jgi:hypothetical protein
MKTEKTVCEERGHYFIPIEIPPAPGAYWSTLVPTPERRLYCRRCGMVQGLKLWSVWNNIPTAVSVPTITVSAGDGLVMTTASSSYWSYTLTY